MKTFRFALLITLILLPLIFGSCSSAVPPMSPTFEPSPTAEAPAQAAMPTATSGFILSSPIVVEGGTLPAEYTCDGASATLSLAWSGAPAGTKSYAVIMHHVASPDDVHWYWVLYDIPADVTSLPKNSQGIGTLGTNSVNDRTEYAPPCSKGPGPKVYTYTVYALSREKQLSVPASQVNRQVLLDAIRDITLASAELHVTYTRK
jgi:Raf kinase inhibitor-like YbhB/YbcL family protein